VELAVGEGPGGLVAEYGALRETAPSQERTRQLADLIVRLLQESGIAAAARVQDPSLVMFRHEGRPYVMGVTWTGDANRPTAEEFANAVRRAASGASVVLLSMTGFVGRIASAGPGGMVLWDQAHLEAAVCGLVTLPGLLEASSSAAFFGNTPYQTLGRLLAGPDDGPPARMAPPDQLPPPWLVLEAGYDGIPAQLVLGSEDGWDKPSGIAVLDAGRLVVVTAGGLIKLDGARGTTSWLMRLPGCVNEPLVLQDGSVLATCNSAVVRVTDSGLDAVAGGFDGNVHLLAGPDGQPWALSGHGASFAGDGTLALTRLGSRAGDQHRYDIYFHAQVHTAGWLGGLRFFLVAAGHSAVVDLARGTAVTRDSWIESPQGYEQHLIVTGPHSVVTAAGSSKGIGVTLFRTDVGTKASEQLASFELNGVDGFCAALDGTGYLLGDMHAGRQNSLEPWPVLLRLPGLRPPLPRRRKLHFVPRWTSALPRHTGRSRPRPANPPPAPIRMIRCGWRHAADGVTMRSTVFQLIAAGRRRCSALGTSRPGSWWPSSGCAAPHPMRRPGCGGRSRPRNCSAPTRI
jgi:hypothetical protein